MYGVLKSGIVIAIHDELDVINKFIDSQNSDISDYKIVKIKKKSHKKYKYLYEYQDLYLVRYGDNYVPFKLYDTLKDASDEYFYDLRYCKDVLLRLLEEKHNNHKDRKALFRCVKIIVDEINNGLSSDIDYLNDLSELNKAYKERITDYE